VVALVVIVAFTLTLPVAAVAAAGLPHLARCYRYPPHLLETLAVEVATATEERAPLVAVPESGGTLPIPTATYRAVRHVIL